jgi:dihydrofolate reductase
MTFLSLDGVCQGPGAPDEDRSGGFKRGGWLVPFVDPAFEDRVTAWTAAATGFLFGHKTYDSFSSVWPTITDTADQNATRLNTLPKFVVATTPVDASWGPVTVIDTDAVGQIASMKREHDGELQIHGSGRLGRSLFGAGLVDELRLVTAPVVIGQGRKLFGEMDAAIRLELVAQDRTATGLVMSRFSCAGDMVAGTYKRGETNVPMPTATTN